MCFPDADAFQIWYLVENDKPYGNMFMASNADLSARDAPCRYLLQADGSITKVHHNLDPNECPLAQFKDTDSIDMRFQYLDMRPGDCMIMSKRTLHMSDPRPHLEGNSIERLAMNVRVLIKPAARPTFNLWEHHKYFLWGMPAFDDLKATVQTDAQGKPVRWHGHKQVPFPPRHKMLNFLL